MNVVDQNSTEERDIQQERDLRLVASLLRGERKGWDTFTAQYTRLIRWRVASVASGLGLAGDEAIIDDATAEVFAAVVSNQFAALKAYAGRSSLATYLTVIATRSASRTLAKRSSELHSTRSFDVQHSRRGGQSEDLGLKESLSDNQSINPLQSVIQAEELMKVRAALDQLPPKQRELIERYHLRSETYREIAKSMKLPIGSIGPTLRRAEKRLREDLESTKTIS